MSTTMTLEQVRDQLRGAATDIVLLSNMLENCADAIDAHLATQQREGNFCLDDGERVRLSEWQRALDERLAVEGQSAYTGAAGGRYTYSFSPCNIGTAVRVRDSVSGEEIDLTDYASW